MNLSVNRWFLADMPLSVEEQLSFAPDSIQSEPVDEWRPDKRQGNTNPQDVRAQQKRRRSFSTPDQVDQNDAPEFETNHHSGKRQRSGSIRQSALPLTKSPAIIHVL
jgi:hypothetical protein